MLLHWELQLLLRQKRRRGRAAVAEVVVEVLRRWEWYCLQRNRSVNRLHTISALKS